MHRYLKTASFDPQTATKLCEAFDIAKKAMHDYGQPELVHEILANKIIGLAREGETDPIELSKRALASIGLPAIDGV
jgi:hypothetical protein